MAIECPSCKPTEKDRFFTKWRYQCREAIKELSEMNKCRPLETIEVLESFVAAAAVGLEGERVNDGAKN